MSPCVYILCFPGTQDFARLGVGIQLYFFTTKFLIILFSILTILSIPAMVMNSQENGGKAFSQGEREFMNQSLNYVSISTSLGGQGVSRNTIGFDQMSGGASELMTPQFAERVECSCKVINVKCTLSPPLPSPLLSSPQGDRLPWSIFPSICFPSFGLCRV